MASIAKVVTTAEEPQEAPDMGTYRSPVSQLNTPAPGSFAPSLSTGNYGGYASHHTLTPLETAFPVGMSKNSDSLSSPQRLNTNQEVLVVAGLMVNQKLQLLVAQLLAMKAKWWKRFAILLELNSLLPVFNSLNSSKALKSAKVLTMFAIYCARTWLTTTGRRDW